MTTSIAFLVALPLAYLVGAVPFGFVLAKTRGLDIREHGSGNIGATNVRRVLGSTLGNLCFALDLLKGAVPTLAFALLALHGTGRPSSPLGTTAAWMWLAIAVATVVGHMFPVYLRFKGGKGVATGFGALLAIWPWTTVPALVALGVWLAALKAFRMVSVASCVAAVSLPVSAVVMLAIGWPAGDLAMRAPFLIVTGALAVLVVVRHRGNLARVRAGTEPKVGAAPTPSAADSASSADRPA